MKETKQETEEKKEKKHTKKLLTNRHTSHLRILNNWCSMRLRQL